MVASGIAANSYTIKGINVTVTVTSSVTFDSAVSSPGSPPETKAPFETLQMPTSEEIEKL